MIRSATGHDASMPCVGAVLAHLPVDALGGAPQRELAQRDQVALAEEVLQRARRRLGHVDLALVQALDQLVGRKIDELDLVRVVEHVVGHRLPDPDAGDLADDVVQALEVLDVHRRVDVDAGVEQLVDVLPALRVARARRVGVRELVDDDQAGLAREGGVEVELLQLDAAVRNALARQDLEALEERRGLLAPVGLDQADDDVDALVALLARGREHRVGLADAGAGAEEDPELAARFLPLLALDAGEELVGVGAVVLHRHRAAARAARPAGVSDAARAQGLGCGRSGLRRRTACAVAGRTYENRRQPSPKIPLRSWSDASRQGSAMRRRGVPSARTRPSGRWRHPRAALSSRSPAIR